MSEKGKTTLESTIDINKKLNADGLVENDDDDNDNMIINVNSKKRVAGNSLSPPPGFTRAHKIANLIARLKATVDHDTTLNENGKLIHFIDLVDDDNNDENRAIRVSSEAMVQTLSIMPTLTPMNETISLPWLKKPFAPREVGQTSGPSSSNDHSMVTTGDLVLYKEDPFKETRRKIALLLDKDLQELTDTDGMTELVCLSRTLQADETLNDNQKALLKVVEELPIVFKNYEELMELPKQIQILSEKLKNDMNTAFDLKKKHNQISLTLSRVETELQEDDNTIKEVDKQIQHLQRRRLELVSTSKAKRSARNELERSKKETGDALTNILNEVEVGKMRKQECEERNNELGASHAEMLARCAKYKDVPFALILP